MRSLSRKRHQRFLQATRTGGLKEVFRAWKVVNPEGVGAVAPGRAMSARVACRFAELAAVDLVLRFLAGPRIEAEVPVMAGADHVAVDNLGVR